MTLLEYITQYDPKPLPAGSVLVRLEDCKIQTLGNKQIAVVISGELFQSFVYYADLSISNILFTKPLGGKETVFCLDGLNSDYWRSKNA